MILCRGIDRLEAFHEFAELVGGLFFHCLKNAIAQKDQTMERSDAFDLQLERKYLQHNVDVGRELMSD